MTRTDSNRERSQSGRVHSLSAEQRLLESGKRLFATRGFEHSTTSAIAKEAGSSESQLLKYFGSKEGLLEAIFLNGWERLGVAMTAASVAASPEEGLRMIFELMIRMLDEDRELRDVMLMEGRRIRSHSSDVLLTRGYGRLQETVAALARPILEKTSLGQQIRSQAVASALIGMLESMLRDQIIAQRRCLDVCPTSDEIRVMFQSWICCLASGFPGL